MSKRKIIVVGAGAAGLFAAGRAAELGAEVILLERMSSAGRKLKITGKGRCNITNTASLSEFLGHFNNKGRFLRQSFSSLFSDQVIAMFHKLGVKTVNERGGRVFTASGMAKEVVDGLLKWNKQVGVDLHTKVRIKKLIIERDQLIGVEDEEGKIYKGDAVIIATGGASYPATGSTGDGYQFAKSVGHKIVPIRPALVPLETEGDIASRVEGLNLRNVKVHCWTDNKKSDEAFGEMTFTDFGLSGPIILTMSNRIVDDLREKKDVRLTIDLKPALDHKKLDNRLLKEFEQNGKKQCRTILKEILPKALIPICLESTEIAPDKLGHDLTAKERKRLRVWLKEFPLRVTGHRSFSEAIVTAGGVNTKEVKPQTMESRLIQNLYFAGEVLNIDADTGGYNLQAAFSTGWLAANKAVGNDEE